MVGDWIGCHQLPERSFYFRHIQFPVCARCTGVIMGQITAALIAGVGIQTGVGASFAMMIPMGVDWVVQYVGLRESTNMRRLITGFFGGAGYVNTLLFVLSLTMEELFLYRLDHIP
jgi:uncharacterized membrane protein